MLRGCHRPQVRLYLRFFSCRFFASNNRYCRCPTGDNGNCRFCTRALFPFRCFNSNNRYCVSSTGKIGKCCFCTRVLFYIAANFHRRTANGRPYGNVILERRIIVGASIARPVLAARPIRIKNGAYRFCVSPTGDNGNRRFCTRALFHIAANFHGRTANGRPYGRDHKTVLSFREWQNTENLHRK